MFNYVQVAPVPGVDVNTAAALDDDEFGDFDDGGFADVTTDDVAVQTPAHGADDAVAVSIAWQSDKATVTLRVQAVDVQVNTAVNTASDGVASALQRVLDQLMQALTTGNEHVVLAIAQV